MDASKNQCVIDAVLIQKKALRYTPAGVPVAEGRFAHHGIVEEAAQPRTLEFELDAIGIGQIGQQLDGCCIDAKYRLTGFLAPKSKRSRQWRLHIQTIEPFED